MDTIPLWQSALVVFSVLVVARNIVEVTLSAFRSKKKADAKRGRMSLVVLILCFLVSGVAAFATLSVSDPVTGMFVLGVAIFVTSYSVDFVTLRWMGEHYSLFIDPCSPAVISDGPFRFIRHPIYLAYMGELMAMWLMAPNMISAGALVVVAMVSDFRSRHEETALVKVFGESYQSYQHKTKKFIPLIY